MAFNRAAALAEGYTEEEIDDYLRNRPARTGGRNYSAPLPEGSSLIPPPPPPGNVEQPTPYAEMGTAALAGAGGLAGAGLAYKGFQAIRSPGVRAGAADLMSAAAERLRAGAPAAPPAAPVAPVAPTMAPAAAPAAPIAPTVAPTAAPAGLPAQMTAGMRAPVSAAPRIVDTATDMVRKLALEKLLPVARAASPVGAAASMLAPSPTGPRVPRSGPLRGSEINPATGAGWTEQELAQYEAAQRQRQPR